MISMDVDRGSLPNDGDANEDWSKLTPELIREVAKHLSPNDAAINLRLLNAETAAALRERYNIIRLDRCNAIPSRGVAIACAETWPGDAFARHWGCPEPWRSLPLPRRLRLLCLAASSHHPPSLDAALTHSGVRLSFEVLQAAAAAGDLNAFLRLLSEGCDCAMAALEAAAHCGHLHLLQWVWSDPDPNLHLRQAFGWARHQRRQHVPLAVSACAGGQGRVLTWLEGLLAAQHQQDQYQIQEQQWQCEQSQLQPQLQMQMQPNQQDQQPLAQGRPAAHAPSTAAAAAAGVAAAAGAAGGAHGIARCSIQISTGSEPGRSRPAAVPDAFALPVPWPRRVVGLTRYAFLDMAAAAAANGHVGILERLLQPGGPYGEYNTRTSRRDHEGCTPAVYASVLLPKVAFGCPHAALERLFRAWVPASLLGAPEESLFRHALLGTSPDWERNCDFALEMTAAGEAALLSVVERGRARGPRGGAEEWEDSEDSEEGGQEEDQEQQQQLEEGAAVRRAVREAVAAVRERAELDLRRVADRPGFLQRLHYLHARGVRVGEVETAFAEALAAAGDVAALAQLLDGWGVSGPRDARLLSAAARAAAGGGHVPVLALLAERFGPRVFVEHCLMAAADGGHSGALRFLIAAWMGKGKGVRAGAAAATPARQAARAQQASAAGGGGRARGEDGAGDGGHGSDSSGAAGEGSSRGGGEGEGGGEAAGWCQPDWAALFRIAAVRGVDAEVLAREVRELCGSGRADPSLLRNLAVGAGVEAVEREVQSYLLSSPS